MGCVWGGAPKPLPSMRVWATYDFLSVFYSDLKISRTVFPKNKKCKKNKKNVAGYLQPILLRDAAIISLLRCSDKNCNIIVNRQQSTTNTRLSTLLHQLTQKDPRDA